MGILKPKSVDSVLSSMRKLLGDLEKVEKHNTDAADKLGSEIAALEENQAVCVTEAGRAAKVRSNFAKLMEV